MTTEEDLNALLKTMRILQGFQNIAKNANVELPIYKFPDRIWELVSRLSKELEVELESTITRHIGLRKEP